MIEEFSNFSDYLYQLRTNVSLSHVTCGQNKINAGDTIEILFKIDNHSPHECDLWIGAIAIDQNGMEIRNRSQDKKVTATSNGITIVKRYLTFPAEARLGIYDLQTKLWYGKPGDRSQSTLISNAALREQVIVTLRKEALTIKEESKMINQDFSKTNPG